MKENRRWLWLVGRIATDLWDGETWRMLVSSGKPTPTLNDDFGSTEAGSAIDSPSLSAAISALKGETRERLVRARLPETTIRGDRGSDFVSEYSTAVLCNGLRHYETAYKAAKRACEHNDLGLHGWALSELVEAATRTLEHDVAADALGSLSEMTRASGTEWALGIEARARALVSEGSVAEAFYRESIDRMAGTASELHLARSRLLYGEWLRRESRRVDAREELRRAHATFSVEGCEAFVRRASSELRATGETVRKRTVDSRDGLTAQERQIAEFRRVAD